MVAVFVIILTQKRGLMYKTAFLSFLCYAVEIIEQFRVAVYAKFSPLYWVYMQVAYQKPVIAEINNNKIVGYIVAYPV